MKQLFFATVSLFVVSFMVTTSANAQLGGNTGGTGGGLGGLTGTGGTSGVPTVGGSPLGGTGTGSSTPTGPEFGTGQIQIDTEPLADTRSTSINAGATGGGGANAGGGNNSLQSLFQGLADVQGQFGNQAGSQGTTKSRLVRGPIRVAFEFSRSPSRVTTQQMATVSTTTFARLPKFNNKNIRVAADGQTLVLTGTVKTESERMLAERVAKLEPGVSKVDNQISVASN